MKSIEINGNVYGMRYTIRALFIFEQITGKAFEIKGTLDNYVFFYSILLASNKGDDSVPTWEQFLDAIDNDPGLVARMNDAVADSLRRDDVFGQDDGKGSKKN